MPEFSTTEYVDIDINIDVDEFFYRMDNSEKQEMFDLLVEDGFGSVDGAPSNTNWGFIDAINKLSNNYYSLSNEEVDAVIKLVKRF